MIKTLGDYIKEIEYKEHECVYCKSRSCNCDGECSATEDDEYVGCPCVVIGSEENK